LFVYFLELYPFHYNFFFYNKDTLQSDWVFFWWISSFLSYHKANLIKPRNKNNTTHSTICMFTNKEGLLSTLCQNKSDA
jgi:hypothetical protein